MKLTSLVRSLVAGACAALAVTQLSAADSPREHLSLDTNWKFHLGDDWPDALTWVNSGTGSGAASERFNDENWRAVNLPHDWAIELPFDRTADGGHGFKAIGPSFPRNSVGWYRRAFALPKEDEGKRIWLTFDGVFRDATVWVNGWFVQHHEGGYYPFREDITDVVHFGGTNVISVRVDATKFEGWFYEGAGIYRHVWLDKTAPVAIAPDGVFVQTEFEKNIPRGRPEIAVEVRLLNAATNAAKATVNCEIISPAGKSLKKFSESKNLKRESQRPVKLESKISSPVLWSPESPSLYKLVTTVSVGGKTVDRQETAFGIRTVGFDPTNGFLLNGKHYELYGTCNHQDMAGVGAALPDALQSFRVAKLKEFGCNAIRTSHNPPTPELLDACDRLGMLIMDESRLLGSDSLNMRKWDDQIRRDRNHPERRDLERRQRAVRRARHAAGGERRAHDAGLRQATRSAAPGDLRLAGRRRVSRHQRRHRSARLELSHRHEHGQIPRRTSQPAERRHRTGQRRQHARHLHERPSARLRERLRRRLAGLTRRPKPGGVISRRVRGCPADLSGPDSIIAASRRRIRGRASIRISAFSTRAVFQRTVFITTNRGGPRTPCCICCRIGTGPAGKARKSAWTPTATAKQVELFLNGESLGKQTMKPNSHLTWKVKYAPGTLSAKGFDANGNAIAETKVETTGDAAQIQLMPDRKTINADGEDVAVFTVSALDAQGRVVPVAQNKINFAIEGAGKIIGVGNGDPSCHEPDTFVPQSPVRYIAVKNWRWKQAEFSTGRRAQAAPEFAPDFDDSSWSAVKLRRHAD